MSDSLILIEILLVMVRLSLRQIAANYHCNTAENTSEAQELVEVLEKDRQNELHLESIKLYCI